MAQKSQLTQNRTTNLMIKAGILIKSTPEDSLKRLFLSPMAINLIKEKSGVPSKNLEDEIISSLLYKTMEYHKKLSEKEIALLVAQISTIYQHFTTDITDFFV